MARLLYTLAFYAAQPLIWVRLFWRARKQPAYRQHIGERYGFYPQPASAPLLWLHAVSVGETRAAEPLIEALLKQYPEHFLLLTHMTPTGRETGKMYTERHPQRVMQAYLPYDLPDAAARFYRHFQPQLGIFMETELWPNIIAVGRARGVPLALVNARLSARSQRGYQRLRALAQPAFAALGVAAAQTTADAERLSSLGATKVQVTGNLKFDVTPDADSLAKGNDWRQQFNGRSVWLAASTRDGEESLILDAYQQLNIPGLLLILVPRHPQRFDTVSALLQSRGLRCKRRSLDEFPEPTTQVWLGDSMGEMAAYYAAADLALVGGSLLPFGGQNLIEAAACGCPVVVGPHTFNFAQATDDAVACGAAQRVSTADELSTTVQAVLSNDQRREAMKQSAIAFSRTHQGATTRTMALLESLWKNA